MKKYKLLTQPFTDKKMEWDSDEKLYVLNQDYFFKRTGIPLTDLLGEQNQVDAFLLSISHRLYNIVYSFANPECREHNVRVKKYIMDRNHDKRDDIANALVSFARAAMDTDVDRVGDEWKLDMRQQTIREANEMDLPLDTKRTLEASGLLFKGRYGFEVEE